MTQLSPENLDRAFALLVECAVKGERCPITSGPNEHPFLRAAHISALAHDGRVKVEISGRNWRRVTITTGKHAGESTAANPNDFATTYLIIDKNGTLKIGARIATKPSAPLTREELSR
jgi:hypothetical protein